VSLLPLSCGGNTQSAKDRGASDGTGAAAVVELTPPDFDEVWRIVDVPAAGFAARMIRTPAGWWALSRRSTGGKALGPEESHLYRSTDGIRWEWVPLDAGHQDLSLRDIAYGAGCFVMVGTRTGEGSVLWSSEDGTEWTEQRAPLDSSLSLLRVVFAHERFFALSGSRALLTSTDGTEWVAAETETHQPQDVTYGNGSYLMVGSGPVQLSEDGVHWSGVELECDLPGACVTDPSGVTHPGIQRQAEFVDGWFYIDQLRSQDGLTWQALPARVPMAHASGYFFEPDLEETVLLAWPAGDSSPEPERIEVQPPARQEELMATQSGSAFDSNEPMPEIVSVPFDDGLTCLTARCVVVGYQLYLVPGSV
jgi:hypothetical protein